MAVKRLGKGLGALIPEMVSEDAPRAERLRDVKISEVRPNPFQPRDTFDPTAMEELKQSIAENGIIQPISVRAVDSGYELIAGERRLRAVQELGFESVPAFLMEVSTDEQMIELSLIENIQREDLNPIDEAKGYQTLMSRCNLTQDEVAKKVGKDRSTITNSIRILKLPLSIQESLIAAEISSGHGRTFLALENTSDQISLWKRTVQNKLSVRQVENIIKRKKTESAQQKAPEAKHDPLLKEAETKLQSKLGTKVRIIPATKGQSGKIEIEYYSGDDLERVLDLMDNIKPF